VLHDMVPSGVAGQSATVRHCGTHIDPLGVEVHPHPRAASAGQAPGAAQSAAVAQDVGPVAPVGPVVPPVPPEGADTTTVPVVLVEPAPFATVRRTT
jgi:hypothetical protein